MSGNAHKRATRWSRRAAAALLFGAIGAVGCNGVPEEAPASAAPADPAVPNLEIGPKGLSADAKLETFESLQLDLEAHRCSYRH